MKVLSVSLVILFLALQTPAFSLSGTEDHGVIKPMPGSHIIQGQSRMKNFASYQFTIRKGKKRSKVEKKGKYWHLRYRIKDANGNVDRSIGREEIVQNYKEAALEKGGEILYEAGYALTFTLPEKGGGTTWAYLSARDGSYNLDIIDEAVFKRQLTFGVEEMKRQLDEKGRVAVYGIHFDIDNSSLKLGAEKVLIEIVTLMKGSPNLKIEIQGHTDNSGSIEHNLDLSKRRAETVKAFVLTYGVAAGRMIPRGFGETKPVAPNDTEENHALNRRVELVRLN